MSPMPGRELRNHNAAVIEGARNGEEVAITVNGVAAATLVPVLPVKPVTEPHPHDLWNDTTDNLGPIQ